MLGLICYTGHMQTLTTSYPITRTFDEGFLPTDHGHKVWYSQAGNRKGIPILLLHGGPGYHSRPENRSMFNPEIYRIIQTDQRGCGNSKPLGKLAHNTTVDLLADMDRLADQLKISSWYVYGSSWGTTLALLYAQHRPEMVRGLVLKGMFLARHDDLFTWDLQAAKLYFPEVYERIDGYVRKYALPYGPAVYSHLLKQLLSDVPDAVIEAQRLLESWEGNLMNVMSRVSISQTEQPDPTTLAESTIFCHYFAHSCFITENQILEHTSRISRIPTWMVSGRYDLVCPVSCAYALHQRLPLSRLEIVTGSGHGGSPWLEEAVQRIANQIAEHGK